jgi:predicted RNase H-like HicB family nuclease
MLGAHKSMERDARKLAPLIVSFGSQQNQEETEHMANTYTAVTKQDGAWWIGWIEEVPGVNCQEKTREKLIDSLRVTLREALEFNRQDAVAAAVSDYTEEPVTV